MKQIKSKNIEVEYTVCDDCGNENSNTQPLHFGRWENSGNHGREEYNKYELDLCMFCIEKLYDALHSRSK